MGKLLLAVAVAAAWASVGRATAREWPTRPMTMVVPVAAGSLSDTVGRIMAQRLAELLGSR